MSTAIKKHKLMSQSVEKDNFKAILVGIFVVASIIGLAISKKTNETSYTIQSAANPSTILKVNELGNGAINTLLNDLSDTAKLDLAQAILFKSSASSKELYAKTKSLMNAFPESKNPLEFEGYISNVFDAITASSPINNIKSVTDKTSDYDIAMVKFIIALQAQTTTSTTDNIQISIDNNPKETALGVFFGDMLIPHRGMIRRAITQIVNQELSSIKTELANSTTKNLIYMFNNKHSAITRHVTTNELTTELN
jgi:hypothetical protein